MSELASHRPAGGVTVVTCTNRPHTAEQILGNFLRQNYIPRELIIVLNNNAMNLQQWQERVSAHANIRIFQLDESRSLGECLNLAVDQASYEVIAKCDDDDYYGPGYLAEQMAALDYSRAEIVGKGAFYLYFEESHTLALFRPERESKFVSYVTGATLVVRRRVFEQVRFASRNAGEDVDFLAECRYKHFKIYSTSRDNFVGIRRRDVQTHTWQEDEEVILNFCQVIGQTDDYMSIANR